MYRRYLRRAFDQTLVAYAIYPHLSRPPLLSRDHDFNGRQRLNRYVPPIPLQIYGTHVLRRRTTQIQH